MVRQALLLDVCQNSPQEHSIPGGGILIAGQSLAERSMLKLFASGIEEILVWTDSGAEWYKKLTERYPGVRIIETSAATLSCLYGDTIILEANVLYDAAVLNVLINEAHRDIRLVSDTGERSCFYRMGKESLAASIAQASIKPESAAVIAASLAGADMYTRRNSLIWRRIDGEEDAGTAGRDILPQIREAEELRNIRREVLLNPGPATTSDSVKYAQVCADICPREEEFGAVMEWICAELSLMAGRAGSIETVLFGGSGTAADEAMLSSCVGDEGKLLIVDNGAYGIRFAKIASVYRLNFEVFKSSGFKPLETEAVKAKLLEGRFSHFAIVYHETTTGLLNPAPELCRFCREHGIVTIVDAVSAFAAIPIDMDKDCFDFMASTSNKNIQGMAGVGFVFCRKEALERIADYPMKSYYLNLWDQYIHFKKTRQTRFTPPVQTLYALRQAVIETKLEGIENRYARYMACWDVLAEAVEKLKLRMLVPVEAQSKLITAIIDPELPGYSFDALHDLARSRGFTIYPGKLSKAHTFRIANIGDIMPGEMAAFTHILANYLETLK
jgi:2-aminoethylphosphonate-pyruvate transaminase